MVLDKSMILRCLQFQRESTVLIKELLSYYKCSRCGKCCEFTEIYITELEYNTLKRRDSRINKKINYREIGYYLSNPCAYLSDDKRCKVNNIKPSVCKNYPFTFTYGTFMCLILCPLGEQIASDLYEFGKEFGLNFGKQKQGDYVDNTIKEVDKFNRDLGVTSGKSMMSLMFSYELFFDFSKYVVKKYAKD